MVLRSCSRDNRTNGVQTNQVIKIDVADNCKYAGLLGSAVYNGMHIRQLKTGLLDRDSPRGHSIYTGAVCDTVTTMP